MISIKILITDEATCAKTVLMDQELPRQKGKICTVFFLFHCEMSLWFYMYMFQLVNCHLQIGSGVDEDNERDDNDSEDEEDESEEEEEQDDEELTEGRQNQRSKLFKYFGVWVLW